MTKEKLLDLILDLQDAFEESENEFVSQVLYDVIYELEVMYQYHD